MLWYLKNIAILMRFSKIMDLQVYRIASCLLKSNWIVKVSFLNFRKTPTLQPHIKRIWNPCFSHDINKNSMIYFLISIYFLTDQISQKKPRFLIPFPFLPTNKFHSNSQQIYDSLAGIWFKRSNPANKGFLKLIRL